MIDGKPVKVVKLPTNSILVNQNNNNNKSLAKVRFNATQRKLDELNEVD